MFFSFFGCADTEVDPTSGQLHDLTSGKYAKDYWGEWIRMDIRETWYITTSHILINNSSSKKTVSLNKQSPRVIEVTDTTDNDGKTRASERKYYLYASRVANTSFTGKVAVFDQSSQSLQRDVAGGKGFISVVIEDLDNGSTTTTETNGSGGFTVDESIPGDDYVITPEGGTPITVTPKGDGDDVGTITMSDDVNFKVSISDSNLNELYARSLNSNYSNNSYSQKSYNFSLSVENTGNNDATAATYKLSFDSGLVSTSPISGILGTIEPGKSKSISINLGCSYDSITGDYAWKKIGITINDTINNKTWNDSVSLRFFKEDVFVKFSGSVNAIIITPLDQTFRSGYNSSISIPKFTAGEYLIAFSGATADSEDDYSFSFNYGGARPDVPDADGPIETVDKDGLKQFDVSRYEPNNTEDTAAVIKGGIHAYLHKNDIDYYKFQFPKGY
jgi:hypothetical protein